MNGAPITRDYDWWCDECGHGYVDQECDTWPKCHECGTTLVHSPGGREASS